MRILPFADRRSLLGLLISISILLANSALAAENYVVISVNPASTTVSVGKHFVPDDVIVIPANVAVTLLGEDGSIEQLVGPASYVVTKEALGAEESDTSRSDKQGKLALIARLLASENERIDSIGGTRGGGIEVPRATNTDPWAIPVETSGEGCFRDGRVLLSRHDASEPVSFAIRVGNELYENLTWKKSENIFDASNYVPQNAVSLTIERSLKLTQISLNRLPSDAQQTNSIDIAAWMTRVGCKQQAFDFVQNLAAR